jgi:hypothetical protein
MFHAFRYVLIDDFGPHNARARENIGANVPIVFHGNFVDGSQDATIQMSPLAHQRGQIETLLPAMLRMGGRHFHFMRMFGTRISRLHAFQTRGERFQNVRDVIIKLRTREVRHLLHGMIGFDARPPTLENGGKIGA